MPNRHSSLGVPKTSRRGHTGSRHKAAVTDSATFGATQSEEDLGDLLLEVLPPDRSTIGNLSARVALSRAAERPISEEDYEAVREKALALGLVVKSRGRGGSIALAEGIEGGSRYEAPTAPAGNGRGRGKKEAPAKDFKAVLWVAADKLRAHMDAAVVAASSCLRRAAALAGLRLELWG
jgi:hypothetical protein